MQPIRNNILFKPYKGDVESEGGIIVPDSVRGESDKGLIVAVGKGTRQRPMRLKAGSEGFRVHQWGEPVDKDGERYYIMEDSAIIALNKN